jgi:hypothetical protein
MCFSLCDAPRAHSASSYRSVRNFVIDMRNAPAAGTTGIHWQVSQSTSLVNIVFEMGQGTQHRGMFMEVWFPIIRGDGHD